MAIDYEHSRNSHSLPGPRAAFPKIFAHKMPQSLLDVGCGIGTWLRVAQEFGVSEIFGVDGVAVGAERLLVSPSLVRIQDFTQPWNLGRKFDVVLCLEVAEHLDEKHAANLIGTLTTHADWVVFGAACVGQNGQHHVNCQWPAYWQKLFNEQDYVCADDIRWLIWDDERIEPWYRQNIFTARRNQVEAGKEPRITPVVHPAIVQIMIQEEFPRNIERIAQGGLPIKWYLRSFPGVFLKKVASKFK